MLRYSTNATIKLRQLKLRQLKLRPNKELLAAHMAS